MSEILVMERKEAVTKIVNTNCRELLQVEDVRYLDSIGGRIMESSEADSGKCQELHVLCNTVS